MNKKRWISATLALSLGLSGTYSLAPLINNASAAEQLQTEFSVTSNVHIQQEQLANFEEIKGFFSEETVDFEKVKSFYEENFQEAVQQRSTLTDDKISQMLELGVQGLATAGQVKQAVDKGLQWYFYNEVRHFDREAGNALEAGNQELAIENLDKAITLFEGSVYITAGKRDNNFGTLTQDFFKNIAIPSLKKAIEEGNETDFHVYRQYFEKTMMKVFVLATIRYASKVPEDVESGNTKEEMEHLAEGYFFFMPIHDYLASGNKEAADLIRDAFASGSGENVNTKEIKVALSKAISAKVNGYLDTAINEDLAAGNVGDALIHAAEANAFSSQLEVLITEQLGEEAYLQLQIDGQKFFEAIEANNAEEAEVHAIKIKELLSKLNGVNLVEDTNIVDNKLSSFEEIKSFFDAEQVDLIKVKKYYDEHFKETVQARKPLIDENISAILKLGVQGQATAGQVKQAVDKGLQWYFYEEVKHHDRQAGKALAEGNKELASQHLEKAIGYFKGSVYVTAGKRDNNFGTLTQDFFDNIAIPSLRKAVKEGNVTDFHVYRQYFEKTMMKVFVLATTRYAQQVPLDHQAGDVDEEKEHLAEGYFFFMPIHDYLASGSKESADNIRDAFASGDGANVNAEEIKTWLARAISAKVNGYASATINDNLASGDVDAAKIHAAEGNAFASQLEVLIKEQLGENAYDELQVNGQKYAEAVAANNPETARKHAFAVLKMLADISGVYFETDGDNFELLGKAIQNEEIVSYVNNDVGRTLGSVRFISEALGASVEWLDNNQKVVIQKGDTIIELTIGSKNVTLNGKVSDDVKLDQPAVLTNDRVFIPVRAAAELLGGKVFYYDGQVVINY